MHTDGIALTSDLKLVLVTLPAGARMEFRVHGKLHFFIIVGGPIWFLFISTLCDASDPICEIIDNTDIGHKAKYSYMNKNAIV